VRAGRGGYCFEHNNLLLAALRQLGYDYKGYNKSDCNFRKTAILNMIENLVQSGWAVLRNDNMIENLA
jgi:hypothetical protein